VASKAAPEYRAADVSSFAANAVRLQLQTAEPWSLTSLKEKLIKIDAKAVSHGRSVISQMAEVEPSRQMFQEICRWSPACGRHPPRHDER